MKEEKESVSILEEGYDSMSRYSNDYKHVYSIPEDAFKYWVRNGCLSVELKGRESMVNELILPKSLSSFNVESIACLPYLRKITAYSEFFFVSDCGLVEHDVRKFWRNTRLEEICVLPWLVDKYKRMFGYWEGLSDAIIKVTAIPDDIAYKFIDKQDNGLTTSENGRTLIKVANSITILEIPNKIEKIAATAIDKDNSIKKIVLLGNSEDRNKDRSRIFEFHEDAVSALTQVETVVFKGPMFTHFYDDRYDAPSIPNLKEVIYPLWNYNHYCFRGSEAERREHPYVVKAENFSTVELIEENGVVYTKDGKYLVSGVDCKSSIVNIKDGVEIIFDYAFCCNKYIEEVYIPCSVSKVGTCAFKSCRNMKKIVFNFEQITKEAETAFLTFSPDVNFYFPNSRFSEVLKQKCDDIVIHTLPYYEGNVTIDESSCYVFDEKGDTFIGVLAEARNIKKVTLPNYIRHVSKHAFLPLKELEEIIVPQGIPAPIIYSYAKLCPKLRRIISGSNILEIEDGIVYSNGHKNIVAVSSSANIQSFVCNQGVEIIAPKAFEGHKELVKVHLPQTIKTISDRAFANTGISEIELPASLQTFGKEVFDSCKLSLVIYDGPIASGAEAYNGATFTESALIKLQKEYKEDFISIYPHLKRIVKTPLPKWLNWLE